VHALPVPELGGDAVRLGEADELRRRGGVGVERGVAGHVGGLRHHDRLDDDLVVVRDVGEVAALVGHDVARLRLLCHWLVTASHPGRRKVPPRILPDTLRRTRQVRLAGWRP
jgi:hypothetical protein